MQLHKAKLTNWYNNLSQAGKKLTVLGGVGFAGLIYLKVWLPLTGVGVPCVFRELTGFLCPGCGITRLCLALIDIDLYQAFRFNMLVFLLVPMYVIYLLMSRKGWKKTSSMMMGAMVVITLLFGILRNIEAFAWLAPTVV